MACFNSREFALNAAPLGRRDGPPIEEHGALVEIKPLTSASPAKVEALLDAAFGTDRHGRTAYRLRAGTNVLPSFSFAAWDDGILVGTLQSWPVCWIDAANADQTLPLIMVGPVAVSPHRQRSGVGRMMMDRLVDDADAGADAALMMIGDPEYYARFFGFSADRTGCWQLPGPVERRRLLARSANGHSAPGGAGAIAPDLRR